MPIKSRLGNTVILLVQLPSLLDHTLKDMQISLPSIISEDLTSRNLNNFSTKQFQISPLGNNPGTVSLLGVLKLLTSDLEKLSKASPAYS